MHLSTHVLDAVTGRPATDVAVEVHTAAGDVLGAARTDEDGRVPALVDAPLEPGTYVVRFDVGAWFDRQDVEAFYPEVTIAVLVRPEDDHLHVPLLLSPFAYSTYRGS